MGWTRNVKEQTHTHKTTPQPSHLARFQQGQQPVGQRKVAQVVGPHLGFEPVRCLALVARHDASVVDQKIDRRLLCAQPVSKGPHGGQVGQVQGADLDGALGWVGGWAVSNCLFAEFPPLSPTPNTHLDALRLQLSRHRFPGRRVAHAQHDARPQGGQAARRFDADAGRAARHDDGAARQVGIATRGDNVSCCGACGEARRHVFGGEGARRRGREGRCETRQLDALFVLSFTFLCFLCLPPPRALLLLVGFQFYIVDSRHTHTHKERPQHSLSLFHRSFMFHASNMSASPP